MDDTKKNANFGVDSTTTSSANSNNSSTAGDNRPGTQSGDTEPQSGNDEQKSSAKGTNPGAKRQKNVTVPGGTDGTESDTPNQTEPEEVSDEERAEFQRLKTKEHNMPLSPEDVDRLETLKVKIEGQ